MKKKIFLLSIIFFVLVVLPIWEQDIWTSSLKKISSIASLIQSDYFQDVTEENIEMASIKGMLKTLDPHSYFLDPRNFSRLTEEYKGKYYGLGIMIQKQGDKLVVITPIEGTPAYRLGIQAGDVISLIDGESTKPITSYEAMQRLRGPKGTKVNITIVRETLENPLELTIERAEIPLHSIPYAFMLQDNVGYIFIRNFAETTTKEFEEKMKVLKQRGMKKLILDLRGNGGGTFVQSIELSDEFLPKGTSIVAIKGRNTYYNREFRAFKNNQYETIPLVVLINQGSASASEIVSGAIKDNDRGLIVGETSWGKGLVQTVFPLTPSAAISLTTAKYFTPSGRSIQRDYSNLNDYLFRREVPEEEREIKYTSKGRKVLGQGGIDPDYEVEFSFSNLTARLLINGAFFDYARKLLSKQTALGKKVIFEARDKSQREKRTREIFVDAGFGVKPDIIEDFKLYLNKKKFSYKKEEFEESFPQIKRELEKEVVSSMLGIEEGIKAYRKSDPVVLKAIQVFPEAEALVRDSAA
ncbi:MAG: S41 family peptidase [Acidobacteriota bacterium]|nr:S41 family peptidase [Acidobacteriota bacterium]